jgi:hypothetical protein
VTLQDWLVRERHQAARALVQAQHEGTPLAPAWARHWVQEALLWDLLRVGLQETHPACLACHVWEDAR